MTTFFENNNRASIDTCHNEGDEMETCLIILKLAINRLTGDDEQERNEKKIIMQEHLNSCSSCSSFVEGLGVTNSVISTNQLAMNGSSSTENGSI